MPVVTRATGGRSQPADSSHAPSRLARPMASTTRSAGSCPAVPSDS